MIKIDLHTHSRASYDGGLSLDDYDKLLDSGDIDAFAITDHKTIKLAQTAAKDPRLAGRIIVGQEILTTTGEIIGLFTKTAIEDGQSARDTVVAIKKQRGFVLIPHPNDPHRSGMTIESMEEILDGIDAVEVFNGRQFSKPIEEVRHWARHNNLFLLANSDAHSKSGVGRTYTMIASIPGSASELREILKANSKTVFERPPVSAYFAPKLNRLRKLVFRV